MKSLVSSRLFKTAVATACTTLSFVVIEASSAQATSLIQNGSFERGIEPGAPFSTLYTGSRAIDGWRVRQGSIDYIGEYWESADGHRSIDLNGINPGGIAQTFHTTVDKDYQVIFAIAGNPDDFPFLKKMQVQAAGQSAYFSFDMSDKSRKNMGWREVSWKFTAVDVKTTLEFISLTRTAPKPAYGIALDNVSVVPLANPVSVPEPRTLAGLFLLSLGVFLKKKSTSTHA